MEEFKRTKKKKNHTGSTGVGVVSCYIGGDRWLFLHKNDLVAAKILNKAIDELMVKNPGWNKKIEPEEEFPF